MKIEIKVNDSVKVISSMQDVIEAFGKDEIIKHLYDEHESDLINVFTSSELADHAKSKCCIWEVVGAYDASDVFAEIKNNLVMSDVLSEYDSQDLLDYLDDDTIIEYAKSIGTEKDLEFHPGRYFLHKLCDHFDLPHTTSKHEVRDKLLGLWGITQNKCKSADFCVNYTDD